MQMLFYFDLCPPSVSSVQCIVFTRGLIASNGSTKLARFAVFNDADAQASSRLDVICM